MLSIGKTITLIIPFASYLAYHAATKAPYLDTSCSLLNIGCPTDIPIQGFVDDEYKEVYDIFLNNFKNGHDVGASISAYVDGRQVLSLQGGWKNKEKNITYTNDTLQMVFSSTKVLSFIAVAQLVDEGLLSYDDRIATHWPEFAQGNKENVTVNQLVRHMAGVGALDNPLSLKEASDPEVFSAILARQPHNFDGEPIHSYHALTQGWYINELIKRADPKHRTVDDFAREFQKKYNIEWYLKPDTTEELDLNRISPFYEKSAYQTLAPIIATYLNPYADKTFVRNLFDKKSLFYRSVTHAQFDQEQGIINKNVKHRAIECPAYSGHTNADSIAKLAAMLANRGKAIVPGEPDLLSEKTYEEAHTYEGGGPDACVTLMVDNMINLRGGFMSFPDEEFFKYSDDDMEVRGGVGAGGSVFLYNEKYKIGFAYVMNGFIGGSGPDYRSIPILRAVFEQARKEKLQREATASK